MTLKALLSNNLVNFSKKSKILEKKEEFIILKKGEWKETLILLK